MAFKNDVVGLVEWDHYVRFSIILFRLDETINEDLSHLDCWLKSCPIMWRKLTQCWYVPKARRNVLHRSNQSLQVEFGGTDLEVVTKTRYLGVQLGSSSDWKEQVRSVSLKVSIGLGLLKHAKKLLPFSALTSLFNTSIVEPHFRYCCSVYGCAGTTEINRLQKLQNRAARIVTNSSLDTISNQLIEILGWKIINEVIDIESKTIAFKSLIELAAPYLRSLFKSNSQGTSYCLRNISTHLKPGFHIVVSDGDASQSLETRRLCIGNVLKC